MTEIQNNKPKVYNLEERTLECGKKIIRFAKLLPRHTVNNPLISQLVRSGTSVGANYREANETSTKKDFLFRMRICRKEAKETLYWLHIVVEANPQVTEHAASLIQESAELVKIFASIIVNSENKE